MCRSPWRQRRRSLSLSSPGTSSHTPCCRASSDLDLQSTPAIVKPPQNWLRMSMRRVRPFRLESTRPSSAPTPPTRPTRGQRRRISSSTSHRRESAASASVDVEVAWTTHALSDEDDEEDSFQTTASSEPPTPRHQQSTIR